MAEKESSYIIHMRTGFFRLDPYDMVLSTQGVGLFQIHDNQTVKRIFLPNLEIQKVVVYVQGRIELEIITPREVFSGVLSKKTDIPKLQKDLEDHFGARLAVY